MRKGDLRGRRPVNRIFLKHIELWLINEAPRFYEFRNPGASGLNQCGGESAPPASKLRVERIKRLRIPERFINRTDAGVSYPTRLTPQDYESADLTEVDVIRDEDFVSYFVDFADCNVPPRPLPKTFRS